MTRHDEPAADDLARALTPSDRAPADLDALIRTRAHAAVRNDRSTDRVKLAYRLVPAAAVLVVAIGIVPAMREEDEPTVPEQAPVAPLPNVAADRSILREAVPAASPEASAGASPESSPEAMDDAQMGASADALSSRSALLFGGGGSADTAVSPEARTILSLLRAGMADAAARRYRVWRAASPGEDAPRLPDGLNQAERRWFAEQAEQWARER